MIIHRVYLFKNYLNKLNSLEFKKRRKRISSRRSFKIYFPNSSHNLHTDILFKVKNII